MKVVILQQNRPFEEGLRRSMVGWTPIELGGSPERPGRWEIPVFRLREEDRRSTGRQCPAD